MTDLTTETHWRSPGAATFNLLMAVIIAPSMTEPLPLWPDAWSYTPSLGAVLLIVALASVLISLGQRAGARSQ
ncbi:hypothetical protein [Brevundimonas sp. FT23042]|uniref:hypothetical protein n=1 Tax=Brevundimonas sp. FT23042 TaxID=3393749 RepID=UPI003B5894C0